MIKPGEVARKLNRMVFSTLLVSHRLSDANWHQERRTVRWHSVWCISKGRGEFIIDDTTYVAEPGKLFFFIPGMSCERRSDTQDPLEYYMIRFTYALAYEEHEQWYLQEANQSEFPLAGMFAVQNSPQFINIFEQLHHLWKRRGASVFMRRKILFQEMLLAIIQDLYSQRVAGNTTLGIELTIDHMVQHYGDQIKLQELAHMAGLSMSHYSRLFKKYVGYSPIDYLTHVRVDRSKELLILSDYRLKAVAQSVGYQDEFYFSRIFKKVVGLSPSEYARRHRSRN